MCVCAHVCARTPRESRASCCILGEWWELAASRRGGVLAASPVFAVSSVAMAVCYLVTVGLSAVLQGGRWAIGPAVAWRGPRGAVLEEKLGRPNPGSCPRGRQGHHPLRAQLTHGNRRPGSCHRPAGQEKHRLLPPIHSPVVSSAGEVDSGLRDRKEAERRALVARSPSEPASSGRPLDAPAPEALLTGGGSPAPTG